MNSKTIIEQELKMLNLIERRILLEKYKPILFFIVYVLFIALIVWYLI
jgi:hypothetical protein